MCSIVMPVIICYLAVLTVQYTSNRTVDTALEGSSCCNNNFRGYPLSHLKSIKENEKEKMKKKKKNIILCEWRPTGRRSRRVIDP